MPKFTEKYIRGLTLPEGQKDRLVFDTETRGLGVRVTKASKTFLLERRDDTGKKYRQPLGTFGAITLSQARIAASATLGRAAAGTDLRQERNQKREAAKREAQEQRLTLSAALDEWCRLHLAHRRPRYAAEAERALRYSLADLLNKPAAKVTRANARDAIDRIHATAPSMAARVQAYARACYRWHMRRDSLEANPFADLPAAEPVAARERVLSDDEMAAVWHAMKGMGYPFGDCFRLLAYTVVRLDESAGARWPEFSDGFTTWTVPAARAKKGRADHVVALAEPVRAFLATVPRIKGQHLLFSTTGQTPISGFSKAKAALDDLSGVRGWRLHDLRRSGVSKLAELGVDPITADKLLDHQPHTLSAIARIYQRHDFAEPQKRALGLWAGYLDGLAKPEPAGYGMT